MQRPLLLFAALALAFGVSGAARASTDAARAAAGPPFADPGPIAASTNAVRPPAGYRAIVARVAPSVVTVHAAYAVKASSKVVVHGLGSGVVVGADGDIVTNYHVVEDATELAVALADGTVLPCRVAGFDAQSDIALLHVDATDLHPIAMGDIEDVEPGDLVLAIGNPLGVGQAVSQGIVSAVVRIGAGPTENFIQTDAAINPGNSGGALVDSSGRLVGINAMILSRSGGSEGIGFAIPVDLVQSVVASLKTRGRVARGWLGWFAQAGRHADGATVVAVEVNGPAYRAGILPGDVVVRVGARRVQRSLDAASVMMGSDPGTHVPVEIVRRGVPSTLDLELAPVPEWVSTGEVTVLGAP